MAWDKIRILWDSSSRQDSDPHPLGRERGQSLVEFAVILPLLLLIVLGTIDLGIGFKSYIALTNASREGARWISIHPTDQSGALARISDEAERVGLSNTLLSDDGYSVTFSPNHETYAAGDKVKVSVLYNFPLLFGAITGLPSIPFTASSTMVVLYNE